MKATPMKPTPREEFARLGEISASILASDGIIVSPEVVDAGTEELVRRESEKPGAFAAKVERLGDEFAAALAQ